MGARFPKKDSHRGLVLVAKVLQNLANGVDFKKEPFMEPLNSFLVDNQDKYSLFSLLQSIQSCTN